MDFIRSVIAVLLSLVGGLFTPVTPVVTDEIAADAILQELTVMNFNVYVAGTGAKSPENRTEKVVRMIQSVMPDSFGVEEADEGWLARLSDALGDEYAYVGSGRNKNLSGEASPVFYLKEKYELVDSETFWLSKTPEKPSKGWDAWINRVGTIAVLRDKQTGFTWAHVNSHFDNSGSISRNEAVAIVSEKIQALNLPTVFTGDLNAKENTLMYSRLIQANLQDTKYLAAETDSGATYHGYMGEGKSDASPIDYIFVNGYVTKVDSYRILRDKIDGIYPSDHFPVVAKLTMAYNG